MATLRCQDLTFQNVRAVLFDKDGTLANSEAFLRSLAQRRSRLIDAQIPGVQEPLLMAFGVEGDRINPAGLMAVATRQENEIAAAAYIAETGRDWVEALEIARSAFAEADKHMPRKAEQTPPIDGVREMLAELAKAKLRVGILSSDSTQHVQEFVQAHQLEPYIQVQLGVDGHGSKTDSALLQQILFSLSVLADPILPTQILVVGDSLTDVKVAEKIGAAGCVGFVGGWATAVHLAQADVIIQHFNEFEILD